MYFCGTGEGKTLKFSNSTFLTVTEHSNISVLQSPALQSVPPGEAVNLQCTVLSENQSAELRVFWIRSAAGSSFPEIIFTHHNSTSSSSSSRQCEISSSKHSSVYNFSTNIPNNHHAATYYCAVETCGRIIIGNGTTVCLTKSELPLLLFFGVFSGVCVLVICVQAIMICKMRNSGDKLQEGAVNERAPNQNHKDDEVNYAPIRITDKKTPRVKKEKPEELVYSQVSHAAAYRSRR
ncbi:hypothetical protein AMEX_G13288 [Astyanax mexicanus]|uniref:Ig-like domain-containing protein n=1 Tax=Astyanax mexicanus TaxID=7994 RepID=A0A8T2LKK3_ASTMX|nr:hypothetical protein AMEX_G13288 [Astyanax mexicanus]